jgi:hypothetical protein
MIAVADWAVEVYGAYAVVVVTIAAYTWRVLRRGRTLADRVDDEQKYWT